MKKGIIAASLLCLMLGGCGKNNNVADYYSDVQGTAITVEDGGEKAETEESAGEAEHKVEFTVASTIDDYEMTADLVIDTRIPENVTTMKVKPVMIDDDYLVSLSTKLFDGGKYEILKTKDYSFAENESIMLEILDSVEEKAEEFNGVFEPSAYYGYLSNVQASAEEGRREDGEYSEGQVILSRSVEVEDHGVTYVCYQERAFIKGDIDGEPYIMEYTKQDYEPNNEMYRDIEDIMIYPMNGRQAITGIDKDGSEEDTHEDNKVSYNGALATAEKCIQQLGLDDYSLTRTFDIFYDSNSKGVIGLDGSIISGDFSSKTGGSEKKGYRFIFTPTIDGMNLSYCAGTGRTTMEYDFDQVLSNVWFQPMVQIDIDATGLRGICMNRVYESEENLTNDSKLISFEKANEIAKQMYSDTYEESYEVGDIRLEYIITQYDDKTVMTPAWVYYCSTESGLKFAINALDGSVVHFGYNGESYVRWFR